MDYQDQLTTIFLQEATELLDDVELAIVSLECSPSDKELLNRIFRAVHTIKGGAGTVGAESLVQFTHVMENVLDRLRAGEINVSMKLATHLLASADAIRELTDALAAGKATVEPTEKHEQLLEALRQYVVATEPETTAPVLEARNEQLYGIQLKFREDILETGQDPLMLLQDLLEIGEVVEARLDASSLPELEKMDPFKVYISWDITLRSTHSLNEVRKVLRFVIDENPICVAQITQSEPSAAAPSPLSPPPHHCRKRPGRSQRPRRQPWIQFRKQPSNSRTRLDMHRTTPSV